MTDNVFFKLMKISERHQWWLEAAEKVTSIGQLIQCILRCPIEHYYVFAKYFNNESKLTLADGRYNDRPIKQGPTALAYALTVTDPEQFKALCDLCIVPTTNLLDITEFYAIFEAANEGTSAETLAPYLRIIINYYRNSPATTADLIRTYAYYNDSKELNNIKNHLCAAVFDLIIDRINDNHANLQFTTKELSAFSYYLDDDQTSRLTQAISAAIVAGDDKTIQTYNDYRYAKKVCGLKFDDTIKTIVFNRILSDPGKHILNSDELVRVLSNFNELDARHILKKLEPYYKNIIKTYHDYEAVSKKLDDEQKIWLYNIIKHDLDENDALRYFVVSEFLQQYQSVSDPTQRSQYFQDMLPILYKRVDSSSGYIFIFKLIDPNDRKTLFEYFKPKFNTSESGFFKDSVSYESLHTTFDDSQQECIFNQIKDDLISNHSVFKTNALLPTVFATLKPQQRIWLFDHVKTNIFGGENFLHFNQFDKFYHLLDEGRRSVVMNNLLKILPNLEETLIPKMRKSIIPKIFRELLVNDRCEFVTVLLSNDLVDLGDHSLIEDTSDLCQFVSLLLPEERIRYLASFKQKAAYPEFSSKFSLTAFTDIANYFPPDERSDLLRHSRYTLQQDDWIYALASQQKITFDQFATFLDIYLNKINFKDMFERIMEHLNFSGTSASPGYSVDEKIHMLEFVLHHPLVAGVNEKTRGQLSPTLFTLKDKAMNCMQLAVRAQIDTLNAELGKKIVLP